MAPVKMTEFQNALTEMAGRTQDQLRDELARVDADLLRTKRLLSTSAKALAKLRARRMAIESRIESAA